MKYQNKPGIYAYYVDFFDKKIYHFYFKDLYDLFHQVNVSEIFDKFGKEERIWYTYKEQKHQLARLPQCYCVAFNEKAEIISTEALIIGYKDFLKARKKIVTKCIHNRRKKGAWGHYVTIKTQRSRRQFYFDVELQELDITFNYRMASNPPDGWDKEKVSHSDKNWKTQSKRKHQWK